MEILRSRPATAADHPIIARLFLELAVDEPPPDAAWFERQLLADTFLVERAGRPIAYAYAQQLGGTAYIRHLVVDPAERRSGVGRFAMGLIARRAVAAGSATWCLNVKPDNLAARRLYEAFGLREAYRSQVVRLRWCDVGRLPPAPRSAGLLPSSEAAEVEEALGLVPGLLASSPDKHTVAVRNAAGVPVGVAAFSPAFPGAFPFRARDAAAARALLEACHAARLELVDAANPWREEGLQVVVEGDEARARQLVGIGGRVTLDIVHYRGAVPRDAVPGDLPTAPA